MRVSGPMKNEPMNKPSILIVEDEPPVLLTYRMILEQQGYNATPAVSSAQAAALLARQSFDLLLCDLSLEENHTGFEVLEEARKTKPDIAFVLLTGYASHEAVERAQREGIAVLFKPIDIEEFLSTVASLLGDNHDQAKASGE